MQTAVCLMGPTATGKTDFAVELCSRFPFDIISVDSALVYRGMDIGTAKPDAGLLARAPHRLIDIRDPEEPYSAGDFVRDARAAIDEIVAAERLPLLVGGTMMYFRALTEGIAELPPANAELREQLNARAAAVGWPALHAELAAVDPVAAARINANDSQRIQRALEVFLSSGQSLSDWQSDKAAAPMPDVRFIKMGLNIQPRARLHERIETRLNSMFNNGFLDEVKVLHERTDLAATSSAIRSVGYRQVWSHLDGACTLEEARYRALVATRQLAKRQITWLRSETDIRLFDALEAGVIGAITEFVANELL